MQKEEDFLFDVHAHHPAKTVQDGRHLLVASGFSYSSNEEVISFSKMHGCLFSLGIGPQEIQRKEKYPNLDAELERIERQAEECKNDAMLQKKFVAIGEVGLDRHWGKSEEEIKRQGEAFERMIRLSARLSLPLVIHSRDAESDCIEKLASFECKNVLMHCFGGRLEEAKKCADEGWLVSIPPIPSAERKKIIKALPLNSLVIESDAPYIGKKSKDAYKAAEMIANYKKIKVEEALFASFSNACKFFKL